MLHFDIQRFDELMNGWDNTLFMEVPGVKFYDSKQKVDVIIGGPPCQAYSLAGRIRDQHGMRDDYRNYLFESYIRWTQPDLRPSSSKMSKACSAPNQEEFPLLKELPKFAEIGYFIPDNLRKMPWLMQLTMGFHKTGKGCSFSG